MRYTDFAKQYQGELVRNTMQYLHGEGTGSTITARDQAVAPLILPLLVRQQMPGGYASTTGMYVLVDRITREIEKVTAVDAITPASVVELARSLFGLSISETADVFHVSRPTIYKWEALADITLIRSSKDKDRIRDVYRAALFWRKLNPALKGRWQQDILPSGACLLDLLKAPQIPLAALKDACNFLAQTNAKRRKEEGERVRKAGAALAGVFAGLSGKSNIKSRQESP